MTLRHISYTVAIATASLLASCESLDYNPADQMSGNTFWKTETHARQAAVGMYSAMKEPWCFGMEFTFDMCSDIADGTSPWADVARGNSFASNSSGVQNHWQYLYELVHRANTVIRNVSAMQISQETIERVTGEARFLRAMAYFRMLQCWGGVPYYDETCDINEQFDKLDNPRISADELRTHILDDLTYAIDRLPVAWGAEDLGRATKGAAYALRGKVYLFNSQWDLAAADFEEIVYNRTNNYGYSLHPDYESLFRLYNGLHSPEMIFSIQSIDGNVAGYALDIVSYFGNKSTMRLIASNRIVPSVTLVDMYENPDGTDFDWDNVFPGFNNADPQTRRRYMCVAINDASTEITSTLECDTVKVLDAYRKRDPRLCWNVITPYSHYLGTDAGSNPMDKQFVLADPTKGARPWRHRHLSAIPKGGIPTSGANGFPQAISTDTGENTPALHMNFRSYDLAMCFSCLPRPTTSRDSPKRPWLKSTRCVHACQCPTYRQAHTTRLQHAYAKSAHANSPVKDSATGTSAAGACWRHR